MPASPSTGTNTSRPDLARRQAEAGLSTAEREQLCALLLKLLAALETPQA